MTLLFINELYLSKLRPFNGVSAESKPLNKAESQLGKSGHTFNQLRLRNAEVKLVSGIKNFKADVFPGMQQDFESLESGQSPETLFITCSDSRISPNLVTQTQPGEIFVIRNAGNIVPKPGTGELAIEATISYAVQVLKVKHIVVCGHSHCGAVTGLLNLDSLETLPAIKDWVKKSAKILEGGQMEVPEAICANVNLQLEHLMEYPYVAEAVKAGTLELHGWVYHFEKGEIEFVSSASGAV